jgi:hypothetical protein
MKFKSILFTSAATLFLTTASIAQVPNYIPTNGLVGWWPFNGNANDESGSGFDGNSINATLTTDRFGLPASCYLFNGSNAYINLPNNTSNIAGSSNFTISAWVLTNNINNTAPQAIFAYWHMTNNPIGVPIGFYFSIFNGKIYSNFTSGQGIGSNLNLTQNTWNHVLIVYDGNQALNSNREKLFVNGQQISLDFSCSGCNVTIPNTIGQLGTYSRIGARPNEFFNGKIDDIGIWNRTLTQQEIADLFNAVNCANNTAITPPTNSLNTGSTATFSASTSDPNPSYVWQSDLGQGFQTLNNIGNYSGTNSNSLSIANVQLPNHTQPIRVITTSGNCVDTSNVAVINVLDTCITNVTVYDTLLTTVTDTLIINATITGLNPPSNQNTLKVFPNPANTHITIDYGNFGSMNGYTLTIVNAIGQTVFTTPINQQTSYIDLSSWTGNGIYYVQLLDIQNNTIENRKIVIQ